MSELAATTGDENVTPATATSGALPHRFSVLAVAAVLASCAGSGQAPQARVPLDATDSFMAKYRTTVPHTRTILPVPVELAWQLLPAVYQELGYPASPAAYTREFILVTPHLGVRGRLYPDARNSDFLDCGNRPTVGPLADVYEVTFAISTKLQAAGFDHTVVETTIDGRARERGMHSDIVSCNGTGKLEQQIADLLLSKAAAPASPPPRRHEP